MFNFSKTSKKKDKEIVTYDLIHRYYRLKSDLRSDKKHNEIYSFVRNKLIEYHTPLNNGYFTEEQIGDIIDFIADKFIENNADLVLQIQPQIQALYQSC